MYAARKGSLDTFLAPLGHSWPAKVPVHTTGRFTKSRGVGAPRGFISLRVISLVRAAPPDSDSSRYQGPRCGRVEVKQHQRGEHGPTLTAPTVTR